MTSIHDGTSSAIPFERLFDVMRERVPELAVGLDEWTRRMMRWHFSAETGSPFWLSRRGSLGFDPLRDIDGFASLALFGMFDKEELRAARIGDLRPRGFAGRPFRVFETGGTTGLPCRIPSITRRSLDVTIYRTMLEARGLADGDVFAMTPGGPHAYGHFVEDLADSWGGAAFAIDFDPRWAKGEIRAHGEADAYIDHLVAQAEVVLAAERPSLLFTTSQMLIALAIRMRRPLSDYGPRAVCTGGTSCTTAEAEYLRAEHLRGMQWIDTYGNTLAGHALQADPPGGWDTSRHPGAGHSYHLPPPLAVLKVVDPADPWRELPLGERGRVRVTTLLQDLFLPNLLERDSAIKTGPHPWFPWDGVTSVRPFDDADETIEGVY